VVVDPGLHLGLHKHHDEEPAEEPPKHQQELFPEGHQEHVPKQASFRELASMTGMEVDQIEEVFAVWMKHTDKTETIYRKKFGCLLEGLCPKRTISENDLNAWWDQVHKKSFAECLNVDWTAADDRYQKWSKASLGAETQQELAFARKTPASFDHFITWWSTCEVRQT